MALSYTVNHAFAQGGVYYTRANQDEVKKLPRDVRDHLITLERITEHDTPASDAEPTTTKPNKGA